ncbi:MAG: GAF domain-containing protein [Hyphomicrobiaceae bacterium]|nr:GAF domain-containing protein [Hyphomicrobiaceae bacterium]
MSKQSFIRVTEVWVPSPDRKRLIFGSGAYGSLDELKTVSQQTSFAYDEGLPGKAWACGRPVILHDLVNSYFKRGEAAQAAGLTCGVALPIFAGPFVMAVVTFFCGDDEDHFGAIELWGNESEPYELGLIDGYFGSAEIFEFSARHTKFRRGFGLPGIVWDTRMPLLMDDLGRSHRFVRKQSAHKVGINRGIGIPCGRDGDPPWILTLLSAAGTPIAKRFECWVPEDDVLMLKSGICESDSAYSAKFDDVAVMRWEGAIGQSWQSGVPVLSTDLSKEAGPIAKSAVSAGLSTLVAVPVISQCATKAIVAWYN